MKTLIALAATASALAIAAPANAVLLQFTLNGLDTDGTVEFASFQLDSNPIPDLFSAGGNFTIFDVPGTFQYGTIVETLQDLTFYNTSQAGGVFSSDLIVATDGPQLYTGPEATPTFRTGTFTLTDYFSGAPLTLTIVPIGAAAVPEPATWGMMILGFGLAGAAMRRRRSTPVLAA